MESGKTCSKCPQIDCFAYKSVRGRGNNCTILAGPVDKDCRFYKTLKQYKKDLKKTPAGEGYRDTFIPLG